MRKSCKYCGRVHDATAVCKHKPPSGRSGKSVSRAATFRNTSAWRKKREEIRERDHYLCKYCASKGRYVYTGIEVHHIEPIEERYELRLKDNNLICLDSTCHKLADRGEISRELLHELAKNNIPPPTVHKSK